MHLKFYRLGITLTASMIFCVGVDAQKIHQGIVLDSITSVPIPYATLKVKDRSTGVYCNENGSYNLLLIKGDSVVISSIGYTPLETPLAEIDTIRLAPRETILDEIIVSDKLTRSICGITEKKYKLSLGAQIGFEYALKIDFPDTINDFLVKRIFLLTNRKAPSKNQRVRLTLYDVTDNGYPGNILLNSQLFLDRKALKNKYIDISNLGIITKKQVFVGVEWIGSDDDDSPFSIRCTLTRRSAMTYYRTLRDPNYSWNIFSPEIFEIPGKNRNPANLIISIEVEAVP